MRKHLFVVIRPVTASILLCMLSTSCTPTSAPNSNSHRILFIGNSLTYANDMPAMVDAIARADGNPYSVQSVATPNTGLIDHATMGPAQSRIAEGGWQVVILQQGPTPAGVCRDTLVMATKILDRSIRAVGARTASLMTWPYDGYPDAFSWVHESVQQASKAVNGIFLPAGDAWVAARRIDPSLQLYGPDGYHPSQLGSLLTAFVVYQGVTGRDVRQITSELRLPGTSIDPATVQLLEFATHAVFLPATVPAANATRNSAPSAKIRATC